MKYTVIQFDASFKDAPIVSDAVRRQILDRVPFLRPPTYIRGPYIHESKYYYTWHNSIVDNPCIRTLTCVVSDTRLGKIYPQRRKHAT